MSPVMLLHVTKLFKCLVTILALVFSYIGVDQHVLLKLLGARETFKAFFALVGFFLQHMDVPGMPLHPRLSREFLERQNKKIII